MYLFDCIKLTTGKIKCINLAHRLFMCVHTVHNCGTQYVIEWFWLSYYSDIFGSSDVNCWRRV